MRSTPLQYNKKNEKTNKFPGLLPAKACIYFSLDFLLKGENGGILRHSDGKFGVLKGLMILKHLLQLQKESL